MSARDGSLEMNRAPVRGPERCLYQETGSLLRGLLHRGLRTAQLQPLFAAAGDESNGSAEQRHNGDLAGVHGITSKFNTTNTGTMPSFRRTAQDRNDRNCAISARLMQTRHDSFGRALLVAARAHGTKKSRAPSTSGGVALLFKGASRHALTPAAAGPIGLCGELRKSCLMLVHRQLLCSGHAARAGSLRIESPCHERHVAAEA